MTDEFLKKVILIAEVKYDFNEDILEAFLEDIQTCWYNGFTPRRTVEFIAEQIKNKEPIKSNN